MKMKNFTTTLVLAVLVFGFTTNSNAQKSIQNERFQIISQGTPAYPGLINFQQPDGTMLNIYLKGDGAIHWAVTTDGYTVLQNKNGQYEFAVKNNAGELTCSGISAKNETERTGFENNFVANISKNLFFNDAQINSKRNVFANNNKKANSAKGFPATGTRKNLVLLVDFTNQPFTYSQGYMDSLMNFPNFNNTGSFKDFYLKNSFGKLSIESTTAGVYHAAGPYESYGGNDAQGNDTNARGMVTEAIIAAHNAGVNFAQFDNDGDGQVDNIYVIFAGYGENSGAPAGTVWAHAAQFNPITYDGVSMSKFACSSELGGNAGTANAGIGTLSHEFGHVLALPDFYDTDYAGSGGQAEGTGAWDLMSAGNYNGNGNLPAMMNPASKEFLNWMQIKKIEADGVVTLVPAVNDSCAFSINSSTANEIFVFENRQQLGFDVGLPGHGMLIYHADGAYMEAHFGDNTINCNPAHQGYDLLEGNAASIGTGTDPFPGTGGLTDFTDATTPNSLSWASAATNKPITGITEDGGTGNITFNISGVVDVLKLNANNYVSVYPTITGNQFHISASIAIKKVTLYNVLGQAVFETNVNAENFSLNIAGFANGSYVLKIQAGNEEVTKKVMIQN